MPQTKLKNTQLPDTISSKTVDNTNTINTTLSNLSISGGTNGQVLSTNGSGTLSWKADGVSDGDKGDITVSGSGATWTIDNGVVTYAKMQNVSAASTLLGRATAGAGSAEEITIGSGLSLSGTTITALGSLKAVVIKSADETVTSSTTLQADDHLTYSLTSGKYYLILFNLLMTRVNTSASPGLRFGGAGNSDGYIRCTSTSGTNTPLLLNSTSFDTTTPQSLNAGVPYFEQLVATLKMTSNASCTLYWAQAISSTTGLTVMKGSSMYVYELA